MARFRGYDELVDSEWLNIHRNTIDGILTDTDGLTSQSDLLVDEGCQYSDVYNYQTPPVTQDQVVVDITRNTVTLDVAISETYEEISRNSSINAISSVNISADAMRRFVHDYTFAIISTDTDVQLQQHFPRQGDGFDNLTPDVIWSDSRRTLILEFATTLNDASVRRIHNQKVDKYHYPLINRVKAQRDNGSVMRYILASMVVTSKAAIMPTFLGTYGTSLTSQLCARYRHASQILQMAKMNGLMIEDDSLKQELQDIKLMISSITPKWHDDTEPKVRVPLSRKRVITDDIEERQAVQKGFVYYKDMLLTETPLAAKEFINKRFTSEGAVGHCNETVFHDIYHGLCKGERMEKKALLQLPNAIARLNTGWIPDPSFDDTNMVRFIDSILMAKSMSNWHDEPDVEKMIHLAMASDKDESYIEAQKERRKYKRVKVKLDHSQELEFAQDGVMAKKFHNDPILRATLERKSHSFSFHAPTDDIDEFLNETTFQNVQTSDLKPSLEFSLDLIREAIKLHDYSDYDAMEFTTKAASTDIFRWASFCSTIAQELAISIKQNTRSDEWIFKRVPEHDCFLIIKPTNSSSHIFYMLVFPREQEELFPYGIARELVVAHNYSYTPWTSTTVEKLTNWIKLDVFLLTMLGQWSRYYGMTAEAGLSDSDVWLMSKLCLLISAEDRAKTEEIFTLLRYICMEKFSLLVPDNRKMIDKLPVILRSRLQVWAVRCMLNVMASPNYVPMKYEEDVDNPEGIENNGEGLPPQASQAWLNMVNPFTGRKINDPAKLVDLFYLGYGTNKNAKAWANAEFDLVKKIIEYENKMEDVRPEHCGMQEANLNDYKFFEWSRHAVCAAADAYKAHLRKTYGNQWIDILERNILQRFAKITWEDLATLKASSIFDPTDENSGMTLDKKTGHKKFALNRKKVAMRILDEINKFKDKPINSIVELLDLVEQDGGLIVDIFKKNQHGGLREIYVLELKSRVVQFFIEELSRALCNELPNEVMMHPDMKLQKPQEHMFKAASNRKDNKLNISSSNDAKVWNQGHHVSKFAQFLCRILPTHWHGLIVNTLKLWVTKQIRLPDGVLNIISKYPDLLVYDDIHKQIIEAHSGKIQKPWLGKGESYVVIESGMMQGLLHYLSSLFHGSILLLRDYYWKTASTYFCIESMTTDLCSSDDSSRMTDIYSDDITVFRRGVYLALGDHKLMTQFSTLFGIRMSPKSTMCTSGIMEFNSEYFMKASLVRPMVKFTYAALGLSISESFMERFELFYTLIEQLLSGGCGIRVAHLTQICQSILHYKMLGSCVNPLFGKYTQALIGCKDPSLGFMLLDHPLVCGIAGHQYNLWNLCVKDDAYNSIAKRMLTDKDTTTTTSGTVTKGVQIRFGDRRKINKLFTAAENSVPNWMSVINDDPIVLYTKSVSKLQAKLKIIVKLTSPGVIQSLSRGNETSNLMASSVYTLNGLSVTLGSNWVDIVSGDQPEVSRSKVSLYKLITTSRLGPQRLTSTDFLVLFPHHDVYSSFSSKLIQYHGMILADSGSRKTHRVRVQVFSKARQLQYDLDTMVRHKWFDEDIQGSPATIDHNWKVYKSMYPWLQDDPKTTLDHPLCPYVNHIQMHNMISKKPGKTRIIQVTGTPVRDVQNQDIMANIILKNQIPGMTLIRAGAEQRIKTYREGVSLLSGVGRIMESPFKDAVKKESIVQLLNEAKQPWNGEPAKPSDRLVRLSVIQAFIKATRGAVRTPMTDDTVEHLKLLMRTSRLGVIGGFTQRQRVDPLNSRYYGRGVWLGTIDSVPLRIMIKDDRLQEIHVKSTSELVQVLNPLRNLLAEFGVTGVIRGHGLCYNLRTIGRENDGAKITIVDELDVNSVLDPNQWSLDVRNNRVILQTSVLNDLRPTRDDRQFSLITHLVYPSDTIVEPPDIEFKNIFMTEWMRCKPLVLPVAKKLLLAKNSPSIDLESDDWVNFVKTTLFPSLRRRGIHIKYSGDLLPYSNNAAGQPDMTFQDFFQGFEYEQMQDELNDNLQSINQLDPLSFSDLLSDLVPQDLDELLEGIDNRIEPLRRINTSRLMTNYWDAYSDSWGKYLSENDRKDILNGYYTNRTIDLARVIMKYSSIVLISKPEEDVIVNERWADVVKELDDVEED